MKIVANLFKKKDKRKWFTGDVNHGKGIQSKRCVQAHDIEEAREMFDKYVSNIREGKN